MRRLNTHVGTSVRRDSGFREADRAGSGTTEGNQLLRDRVTDEEIAEVVAKWTGIPVARLMSAERQKLLHLEDEPSKCYRTKQGIVALSLYVEREQGLLNEIDQTVRLCSCKPTGR